MASEETCNDRLLFERVEIEINTHCNRVSNYCPFCPNAILKPIDPPCFMEEDLYKTIIKQLKEVNFSSRLSYHFYGEPLLHPHLEEMLEFASNHLPQAQHVLYTNGDLLSEDKYNSIMNAGEIEIVISNYPKKEYPHRPHQNVLQDMHIDNRGGLFEKLNKPMGSPCFAPSHRLVIAYNGDVLLCYEDAKRVNVFGNINKNKITEIWLSEKFRKTRKQLSEGKRFLNDPCKICNNQAHVKHGQVNVNIIP